MSNLFFLLESTTTGDATAGVNMLPMILIYAGFFAFLWFVLIRPQKKRQKETARMQSEIKIGDSILTTGGLYGTIVDVVNDLFIVEFGMNKGVRVPVTKSSVVSVKLPDLTVIASEE